MNLARISANISDWGMCAMMWALQRRHRLPPDSREVFERYIAEHSAIAREQYFAAPPASPGDYCLTVSKRTAIRWFTPVCTAHGENNHAHVDYYGCELGPTAPTVLMLHALMSASDFGYRRWAADFNARGWNACFVHLPYHYSRRPGGHRNGELAITSDCVRTAEGLRQGVCELRQLMALLRMNGCREFGLWATSYGGWIGALLASVERDFRFLALMAPIVDVTHAIWESPAAWALRPELVRHGIARELIEEHFAHVSPLHAPPLDPADRALLFAGEYDHVAPAHTITRLYAAWPGARLHSVPQGHFGYRMMRTAWAELIASGALERLK
jgi:pimeloyl-ACP methyl ester carboxylesterase